MAGLYGALKDVYDKVFVTESFSVDHVVSKLHYRVTVTILIAFSLLLSLQQYAGDPIDCQHDLKDPPENMVDNFCWVEGTYTKKFEEGKDEHFGKAGHIKHWKCDPRDGEDCWHHLYYQWVGLVLVCQAGFFYLPKYLWQIWENGKVKSLVESFDRKSLVRGLQSSEDVYKDPKLEKVITFWRNSKGSHDVWAWKFYVCEALNLANIFLQYFFTDFFLQYHFSAVARGGFEAENVSVLPITATCYYNLFGSGGENQPKAFLCVLPLNMVNQKFFTFFYFWLAFLLLVTVLALTLRLFLIFSPEFREITLQLFYGVRTFNSELIRKCSHGDWLLTSLMIDNMNPIVRAQFIRRLGDSKEFNIDE